MQNKAAAEKIQNGTPKGQPVMAEGLIARNSGGVIKIYDVETNMEVIDIEKHQIDRMKRVRLLLSQHPPSLPLGTNPRTRHTPEPGVLSATPCMCLQN